jgi:hypothetical protein
VRIKAAIAVLSGVACFASVAVAADAAAAPAGQTVAGCDPSWHLVAAPPAPGPVNNILTNVDVVSSKDAWFTGPSYPYAERTGSEDPPEIMMFHWNGKAVGSVPSPAADFAPDLATDVGFDLTLDSPADGWLGAGSTIGGSPALRLHDGRWTPMPTAPAPSLAPDGSSAIIMSDAASISASNAWAVGGYGSSRVGEGISETAMIEHWDGTQWTVAATPPPPDPDSQLLALTAVSPSDIWAIGWQGGNSYTDTIPLVEHFDGTAWHLVAAPAPGGSGTSAYPEAISGTGPDDIWMAGTVSPNGDGGIGTGSTSFVEHWNGASWSLSTTSLPAGAIGPNSLYAASPTDVWATQTTGKGIGTSFLHFDGHSWTTVPFPGPQEYGVSYTYYAISGSGPDDVWAVGTETTGDVPLIAHLSCSQEEDA